MTPSNPAPATPMPPPNPDSQAAELMSPGSIGQPGSTPAPPTPTFTSEAAFYSYLRLHNFFQPRAGGPQKPGFTPFQSPYPPLQIIQLPNARIGDGSGTSPGLSVDSLLQILVAAFAGDPSLQGYTDQQINDLLMGRALDLASINGPYDPTDGNVSALVAKYTATYRTAVTPV